MTDSGSQDIPAWLKLAWSKPPKKGDILFRSVTAKEGDENDWETNARVSKASEYAYAEGYRLAGRILAAHVIQNKWDADFLVYPIVFLYRHNVELQFKRLIPMGASLTEQALSEADWRMLQESHDLSRLWALFKPILQIAGKGLAGITVDEVEGIGSYVRQLHEIDRLSYSFRYVATKVGSPSIDKNMLPHINIGVLAEGMEKLTGYLFGLGETFHEALQVKCTLEDEARSEYME